MTEILIYSLIIAVLMLLPALWALYEQQANVNPISQARKKTKSN